MVRFSHHRTIPQSLREYGRGIVGGILFSLPLLYTMEVWEAGLLLHPLRIVAGMGATFLLLIAYNRHAGLRKDASLAEVVIDSVEEMGIGLVIAAAALWMMGRLTPGMPPPLMASMISVEAMTVAIGVSVGTAQLGADDEGDSGFQDDGGGGFTGQCAIALCGAVLFAANIAPTDEVAILAMESSPLRLLGIAAISLALGSWVLHYAGFRGASGRVRGHTPFLRLHGTLVTYAIALLASAGALFLFGRLDDQSPREIVARTVVLGLPAVLGASAGRLLLQSNSKSS